MEERDTDLRRLLALDEAPSRDVEFELAVAGKLARARLKREAVDWALAGLVAGVVLWAAGPWLAAAGRAVLTGLDGAAPAVIAASGVTLALALAWVLPPAFEIAPPREEQGFADY